jgi:serine/threonine protein kinase
MTPEELSRIRRIYEQALPLAGSARETFLRQECQGADDIRAEIERLLSAHENIPTWLEPPVWGPVRTFADLDPPKLEGRRLSGYILIREIGRGGMGSVYLAERSDEMFQRQAAVKLILPPAGSAGIIARFQREREILASLDHPNIAKLLDAGVTEEGWPYFIMEFVDGRPIHHWCDERKLNISERVKLFGGVIDAVRYAHRNLVVHRDLKPGNIFVTNDGVVKLLDFGIAKALSGPAIGKAPDTQTLAGMMTPEYASPEQVSGAPVTTQSDLYSLGVVLYELLTGHRPYRLLSAAVHEVARVIAEVEPARPSDVVGTTEPGSKRDPNQFTPETISAAREGDPKRLRKRLLGDLDSILLMALRKEPERRYGSVDSFADDLQRHLDQRPVAAREESTWERLVRFRHRNFGGFFALFLIAFLFLDGVFAVVWQARHDIQAAVLDPRIDPFPEPFLIFSYGLVLCAMGTTVYFALRTGALPPLGTRAGKAQRVGAFLGGAVWGIGMTGRWWIERDLGWWHSRIVGHPDPLLFFSGRRFISINFWTNAVTGGAVLMVLVMIGRRFGWKGQAIGLVLFGLGQPLRERIWFGTVIPALTFAPGVVPILVESGNLIASGLVAMLVMRAIVRLGAKSPDRESLKKL